MLDRSLALTFKHLWTLFLMLAALTLTVHLLYTYSYRNVIEVSELHPQIERFEGAKAVRDVTHGDLQAYRVMLLVISGFEILLVPVLASGAWQVLEDDEAGLLPTTSAAWRAVVSRRPSLAPLVTRPGYILSTAAIAGLIGWLTERLLLLGAEPLSDPRAWVGVGVAQALSRALGAPFVLVMWALSASRVKEQEVREPKLY